MTDPVTSLPVDPELATATEQTDLSGDDGPVEGEAIIDLNLSDDLNYDVDDLGDGQIVIQYWHEGDTETPDPEPES